MYESYWKLTEKPFEHSADSRFYYPSETHQVALLKLRYAIENRRGAALLSGMAGTGKTLLIQTLQRRLSDEFAPFVRLVFPQMPAAELLAYLAEELGAHGAGEQRHTIDDSVHRIQRFLAENAERGRHAVITIDEAQLLDDPRTLEAIRLLLNFETNARPQLTFLLAGQPGLLSIMDRSATWDERLAAKCLLRPMNSEETMSYISHRLTAAGAERAIFDNEALEAIHEASAGIARRINRLADMGLLIGYAEELPIIGRSQIEALSQEFATA